MTLKQTKIFFSSLGFLFASILTANAHPHVFIEPKMEIVLNEAGKFTELRHVWRFDELFSSTVIIDYDTNADGKLDESEMLEVSKTVKASIAEYDFYTAMRSGKEIINFYEPEKLSAYMEDGQMIMFFSLEPEKPHDFKKAPLRVSASDTSYYVAFEFSEKNIEINDKSNACKTSVTIPDYDELYSNSSETLTEAYFSNPDKPELGDEFFAWAEITC